LVRMQTGPEIAFWGYGIWQRRTCQYIGAGRKKNSDAKSVSGGVILIKKRTPPRLKTCLVTFVAFARVVGLDASAPPDRFERFKAYQVTGGKCRYRVKSYAAL
jgi:hypothetical protein